MVITRQVPTERDLCLEFSSLSEIRYELGKNFNIQSRGSDTVLIFKNICLFGFCNTICKLN